MAARKSKEQGISDLIGLALHIHDLPGNAATSFAIRQLLRRATKKACPVRRGGNAGGGLARYWSAAARSAASEEREVDHLIPSWSSLPVWPVCRTEPRRDEVSVRQAHPDRLRHQGRTSGSSRRGCPVTVTQRIRSPLQGRRDPTIRPRWQASLVRAGAVPLLFGALPARLLDKRCPKRECANLFQVICK